METTYQVDLTLEEIEELERALMTYQDHVKRYDVEIQKEAQKNISSIINKLNKA